jgi:hypothetical protein
LGQRSDDRTVGEKISVKVAGLYVEDVDKDADVGEDVGSLLREIVFHEGILSGEQSVTIRYLQSSMVTAAGLELQCAGNSICPGRAASKGSMCQQIDQKLTLHNPTG